MIESQLMLWHEKLDFQRSWVDGLPDIDKMIGDLDPHNIYSTRARAAQDMAEFLSNFTGRKVKAVSSYFVTLESNHWKFLTQD